MDMMKKKMVDRVVEKVIAGNEKGWEQLAPLCEIKWQERLYVPETRDFMKTSSMLIMTLSQQDTQVTTKRKNLSPETIGGLTSSRMYRNILMDAYIAKRPRHIKARSTPHYILNAISNTPWEHISVILLDHFPSHLNMTLLS